MTTRMQIIILFCITQRDVMLRSTASPEPSPGNTGPVRLQIDVGRRGVQGEGGNKQDWRMGRAYGCVQQKYVFFDKHRAHSDAQFLIVAPPLGKIWVMQMHGQILPPCNFIVDSPRGNKYMSNRCIIGGGSWGGVLITQLA
jgi:hypothetical protein